MLPRWERFLFRVAASNNLLPMLTSLLLLALVVFPFAYRFYPSVGFPSSNRPQDSYRHRGGAAGS